MLNTKINELIAHAMKNGDAIHLNVLRSIKTVFLNWGKTPENTGKELAESDELKMLLKMRTQREDSIAQYKAANRMDLADQEAMELDVLLQYIPSLPSDEQIATYTREIAETVQNLSMKDMKTILSKVQEKYPTANGKIVSQVVKNMI